MFTALLTIVVESIGYLNIGNNPKLLYLGRFGLTEPTNTETNVIVNDPTFRDSLQHDFGRHFQANFHYGEQGQPIIEYFYVASPSSRKITRIQEVGNDWESLAWVIKGMEQDLSSMGRPDRINAILGYGRSFTSSYVGGKWDNFAGSSQTGVSQLDGVNDRCLPYFQYFGDISKEYNPDCHPTFSKSIVGSELLFPLDNETIDASHFFASLDGSFNSTGRNYRILNQSQLDALVNCFPDLGSWGGDLQTQSKLSWISSKSFVEQVIENTQSYMPAEDFYADVDAINVSKYINEGSEISESLMQYKNDLINPTTKYSQFYRSVSTRMEPGAASLPIGFEKAVFRMLHLELADSGAISEMSEPPSGLLHYLDREVHNLVYTYLNANTGNPHGMVSLRNRAVLAREFSVFVLGEANVSLPIQPAIL